MKYLSARFWNKLSRDLDIASKERPNIAAFTIAAKIARTLAVLADLRNKV